MSFKVWAALCAAAFISGLWSGCKYQAGHAEVQTKVVEHVQVQEHVITQVRTIVAPNGTKTTDTTITRDTATDDSSQKLVSVPASKTKWHISADANTGLSLMPFYGLQVEHSFVGPISLGLRGDTRGTIGVVVGLSF